jgi:hypothetical protein
MCCLNSVIFWEFFIILKLVKTLIRTRESYLKRSAGHVIYYKFKGGSSETIFGTKFIIMFLDNIVLCKSKVYFLFF